MGIFGGSKSGATTIASELSAIVESSDDKKLADVVARDQQAILSILNPNEKVVFLGRAVSSDASTLPMNSTVFVTDLRVGYSRRGKIATSFPIRRVTCAAGGYATRFRVYRTAIAANGPSNGLFVDFQDEPTQLAFLKAVGYERS